MGNHYLNCKSRHLRRGLEEAAGKTPALGTRSAYEATTDLKNVIESVSFVVKGR